MSTEGTSLSSITEPLFMKASDLAVDYVSRHPRVRRWAFDQLSRWMDRSYTEGATDEQTLQLQRWFGASLRPLFDRLVAERPRAAKAIVRFVYSWSKDVRRRTARARQGAIAPATVVIEPTDRCNLNCPGCYSKSTRGGVDLNYDVLHDLVEQLHAMGTTLVTLSGGEPFLREKEDGAITKLAMDFQNLGFLVYTNGLLIDEEIAGRLGEAGNVFPAISVEGLQRHTDARRGAGTHSRTSEVREMLADHEVMYGFSATATRENCDLLADDAFIEERIAQGDLFGWYFIYQLIGRSPKPELLVTAEQRERLRDQIYRYRADGRPIFVGDFWNDGPLVQGCMAGARYYFHIYADGNISPCVFSPIACGNVHDILSGASEYTSIGDFITRHPFFVAFRECQKRITDHRAPCVLIDHPELIREICGAAPWFPGKNMPEGYLDGEISRAIDDDARYWNERLRTMPYIPDCVDLHRRDRDEDLRQQAG